VSGQCQLELDNGGYLALDLGVPLLLDLGGCEAPVPFRVVAVASGGRAVPVGSEARAHIVQAEPLRLLTIQTEARVTAVH